MLSFGCNSIGPAPTATANPNINPDQFCRQTIQNLYNIQFYCPDDLSALQSLYTESFLQRYNLTLDRCQSIQKYEITKFVSQGSQDYPQPLDTPEPDTYGFYIELLITPKPNVGAFNSPDHPSPIWLQTRIENGKCKVDNVNNGG